MIGRPPPQLTGRACARKLRHIMKTSYSAKPFGGTTTDDDVCRWPAGACSRPPCDASANAFDARPLSISRLSNNAERSSVRSGSYDGVMTASRPQTWRVGRRASRAMRHRPCCTDDRRMITLVRALDTLRAKIVAPSPAVEKATRVCPERVLCFRCQGNRRHPWRELVAVVGRVQRSSGSSENMAAIGFFYIVE